MPSVVRAAEILRRPNRLDDTMFMLETRRYVTPFALLALLLFIPQMTARVAFAWYCEGRVCGVTLGQCCCEQNPSERDPQCDVVSRVTNTKSSTNPSTICAAGCNCKMVLEASDNQNAVGSDASNDANLYPPLAIIVPTPFVPVSCCAEHHLALFIEARGPPVASFIGSSPSLRAPPHV